MSSQGSPPPPTPRPATGTQWHDTQAENLSSDDSEQRKRRRPRPMWLPRRGGSAARGGGGGHCTAADCGFPGGGLVDCAVSVPTRWSPQLSVTLGARCTDCEFFQGLDVSRGGPQMESLQSPCRCTVHGSSMRAASLFSSGHK